MNNEEKTNKIRELFAQARKGDAAALEDALELLRPRLISVIASRIPDVSAREDIAQDTMLKILRVLPVMPKDADPYAYFLTMAKNKAVDYIRKQSRMVVSENIDLLANDLLDAEPADHSVFNDVISFILALSTAPYRILVYLNNRFVYPSRYGEKGRHRGFPGMILEELGPLKLKCVSDLTFDGLHVEFALVEKEAEEQFCKRLENKENGVAYAEIVLRDTLGERPAAIISMWTDRINRQVMVYAAGLNNY